MEHNEIILLPPLITVHIHFPLRMSQLARTREEEKFPAINYPHKKELQSKDSRVQCSSFDSLAFECCRSPHPTHLPREALPRSWALRNNETLTSVCRAASGHFEQIGSCSSSISCIPPLFDKFKGPRCCVISASELAVLEQSSKLPC